MTELQSTFMCNTVTSTSPRIRHNSFISDEDPAKLDTIDVEDVINKIEYIIHNENEEKFKKLDNEEKILNNLIEDTQEKLKKLNKLKRDIITDKINFCQKTFGHDLYSEREDGPYGERYTYCTRCNYNY